MRLLLIAASIALTACATGPRPWIATSAQAIPPEQAKAVCDYETSIATPGQDLSGSISKEFDRVNRKNELIVMCMRVKGYTLGPRA